MASRHVTRTCVARTCVARTCDMINDSTYIAATHSTYSCNLFYTFLHIAATHSIYSCNWLSLCMQLTSPMTGQWGIYMWHDSWRTTRYIAAIHSLSGHILCGVSCRQLTPQSSATLSVSCRYNPFAAIYRVVRSLEDESRYGEKNANRNPKWWGDFSQPVKIEKIKFLGISRHKVELRFCLDSNSKVSRGMNSNWDFCLFWIFRGTGCRERMSCGCM